MKKRGNIFLLIRGKGGQVWIETVLYTLIAFTLIGLVLTFIKPKIEEFQDKGVIEQSIKIIEDMDSLIKTLGVAGNQRVVTLVINKGELNIDGQKDLLFFKIESRYTYSEPGQNVTSGNLIIRTDKIGKINDVTITQNYTATYNITFQGTEGFGEVSKSSTPYKIIISNKGLDSSGRWVIDLNVI